MCTNAVVPQSPSPPSLQVVTLACGQHGALCAECPVLWVASAWHNLCLSPALQLLLTWGTNNAAALPVLWGIPTPSLLPMHCRAGRCCVGWGSCGQPSCEALTSIHCRLGCALVPTDCCFGDQKLVLWSLGGAGSSTQSTATATVRDSPVPAAHLGRGSFFSDDGGEKEMNRSYHHRAAQGQYCTWRQSRKSPIPMSPHPHVPTYPCPHASCPHSSSSSDGFGIAAIILNSHYCSKERPQSSSHPAHHFCSCNQHRYRCNPSWARPQTTHAALLYQW